MCEDSELVEMVSVHVVSTSSDLVDNVSGWASNAYPSKHRGDGCCSARGRKPGLGKVYTCVRSMGTLGFPLLEWRLPTASWTERNVSLDATAPPATSPHL
jgi:hypothetical protein